MDDPFEAEKIVLENWKKERAQLDAAIAILESKVKARTVASGGLPTASSPQHIAPDMFFRMTVQEAIKKVLMMVGKPARPAAEIADALKRGGNSGSYTTVYICLKRLMDKKEVVRAGKNWGLDQWYPRPPSKLRALIVGSSQQPQPIRFEEKEPETTQEQGTASLTKTGSRGTKGDGRKKEVEDFIRAHGPSTRIEMLTGTHVSGGSFHYCTRDKERFVRDKDGKWRNVD